MLAGHRWPEKSDSVAGVVVPAGYRLPEKSDFVAVAAGTAENSPKRKREVMVVLGTAAAAAANAAELAPNLAAPRDLSFPNLVVVDRWNYS